MRKCFFCGNKVHRGFQMCDKCLDATELKKILDQMPKRIKNGVILEFLKKLKKNVGIFVEQYKHKLPPNEVAWYIPITEFLGIKIKELEGER